MIFLYKKSAKHFNIWRKMESNHFYYGEKWTVEENGNSFLEENGPTHMYRSTFKNNNLFNNIQ